MKPLLPLLAATFAGALAGCATSSGSGGQQPEYMPMHGGPGYGPTGPMAQYNAAPEGPPPTDVPFNSDALGGYGGGGPAQSASYGASASPQSSGSGAGSSGTGGTAGSGMPATTGNAGGGSSGSQQTGTAGMSGAAGGTAAAGPGTPGDQQSMCELQRRVTAARTPEERRALLDQSLPGMTPETQERHLQVMSQGCQ